MAPYTKLNELTGNQLKKLKELKKLKKLRQLSLKDILKLRPRATKATVVQFCFLSIAIITVALSIQTAVGLKQFEDQLNNLHRGNVENLRTCLWDLPDTSDCSDPRFCTKYINPAKDNDEFFFASEYNSCTDSSFCKTFFQATEGTNETAPSVAALSSQWNNILEVGGVSITGLIGACLMLRSVSGISGSVAEVLHLFGRDYKSLLLRSLRYLKFGMGILSILGFLVIAILLSSVADKSLVSRVVAAGCYDYQGLTILSNYQTSLASATSEQLAFVFITAVSLLGEYLSEDTDSIPEEIDDGDGEDIELDEEEMKEVLREEEGDDGDDYRNKEPLKTKLLSATGNGDNNDSQL
eukprot:m.84965 g.84965  ORF g.84965 m.84965 type:complete len:353 (-) comp12177_c0_seq2:106-1164(-)